MKKTKQQRRLEVLKDALKQLRAKKIIANTGSVFNSLNYELDESCDANPDTDAQEIIKKLLKTEKKPICKVCARGALLISTIHKENNFKIDHLFSTEGSFDENYNENQRLLKLFSKEQLCLMENAFEVEDIGDINYYNPSWNSKGDFYGINYEHLSDKKALLSVSFGKKYKKPNDRLEAILKNAIKNNGLFKP